MNTKDLEIVDAFGYFLQDSWSFLFGYGWGGLFQSISVGQEVRFVHNFIMYHAFKAGVIGFIFAFTIVSFLYGSLLVEFVSKSFSKTRLQFSTSLHVACLLTFTSSFFLQANFKSLSFGLIVAGAIYSLIMLNQPTRLKPYYYVATR